MTDRPKAEAAARAVYRNVGVPFPAVRWHNDPVKAHTVARVLKSVRKFQSPSAYESVPPRPEAWAPVQQPPSLGQHSPFTRMLWAVISRPTLAIRGLTRHPEAGCCFVPNGQWAEPLRQELNRSCAAAWFSLEAVDFSEQPLFVRYDSNGRLHCPDGPAVLFPGEAAFRAYFVGGHMVGAWVEDSSKLTAQDCRQEHNLEVRRLMIERVGWLRYLTLAGAHVLDRRVDEVAGAEEVLVHLKTFDEIKLVCGYKSKDEVVKVFAMDVPEETRTCEGAQRYLSSGLARRTVSAS